MRSEPSRPLVVLTCGVARAGKTTFARSLEARGFVRLSVDEELWRRFGRYGVDYPAERYDELSAIVEAELRARMVELIQSGHDIVVDSSFWQRAKRDRYKRLVEEFGGHWRLVYLRVELTELRRRLAGRAGRFDANAAFPITDEILERFLGDFEPPAGEGEESSSALLQSFSMGGE